MAPDRRGLLPDSDVKRLEEFGAAIRERYGKNLVAGRIRKNTGGDAALDGDLDTFWSAPPGARHAALEVEFAQPVTFDRAVTMEWLNEGQRIQHYRVEIWNGGRWVGVAEGRAMGHKKIDAFSAVTAARVRLRILAAAGEICVREFRLFGTGLAEGASRPTTPLAPRK